jgi:hypothetical protein
MFVQTPLVTMNTILSEFFGSLEFLFFSIVFWKNHTHLGLHTVRRPVVKFHSTARMYMDQSLPGTESVFCFWPVLNPAPQCNFPMALENFIVEPFHGQEFSTNAHSQTWNIPLVLYINGIFRLCSFH